MIMIICFLFDMLNWVIYYYNIYGNFVYVEDMVECLFRIVRFVFKFEDFYFSDDILFFV